jgi:granule-bound starch synthase
MRAGISSSDALVTVSPGYARELLTSPEVEPSLRQTLAQQHLHGILNGLDTGVWDPQRDACLPQACRYGAEGVARGKAAAKELLQARLGLHPISRAPLLAFVGRLEGQKGLDVLLAALPQLLGQGQAPQQLVPTGLRGKQQQQDVRAAAAGGDLDIDIEGGEERREKGTGSARSLAAATSVSSSSSSGREGLHLPGSIRAQLVVLGKGQVWMEEVVAELGQHYPSQAVGVVDFNESLAHLIMAGADYLLIPSRFEPCGLVALAALRYGTLPIASDTGGLRDIVGTKGPGFLMPCPGDEADAFAFRKGVAGLVQVVQRALGEYGGEGFEEARVAAMMQEVSWEEPSRQWEMLLGEVIREPGERQPTGQQPEGEVAGVH